METFVALRASDKRERLLMRSGLLMVGTSGSLEASDGAGDF